MSNKSNQEHQEYLKAAAKAVDEQASLNPSIGVPIDPDVAEFMGAFEEDAVNSNDFNDEEAENE